VFFKPIMFPRPGPPVFGITHPLGLVRPLDVHNFFGAQTQHFARNIMPIPCGCLAYFDAAVYRPYARDIVTLLQGLEFGWEGPVELDDPPRYCFLRDGFAAEVPEDLRPLLPEPPRVSLDMILEHFSRHRAGATLIQLLDVLTLVSEDLGPARFAAATAGHPWVAAFLR
jgi:hypothetical protein